MNLKCDTAGDDHCAFESSLQDNPSGSSAVKNATLVREHRPHGNACRVGVDYTADGLNLSGLWICAAVRKEEADLRKTGYDLIHTAVPSCEFKEFCL